MTIKDLSKIIKRTANSVIHIPMANFRGYAVAIDAGVLIYSKAASAYSRVVDVTNVLVHDPDPGAIRDAFFKDVFAFLTKFLDLGIEPILVFDGPTPLPKKEQASVVRAGIRDKAKKKLADLEGKLAFLDPLKADTMMLNDKRRLMKQVPPYFGEWANDLKLLCQTLGILYVVSTEESDRLAAALVREGRCAAVYTTDYDVLIHGTHLMLKGIEWNSGQECFVAVVLEQFMRGLKISYTMLVDLAITLGCDYNIRSKKEKIARVGAETALDLIHKYRRIENFPPTKEWSALNYEQCRKVFYPLAVSTLSLETNFRMIDNKPVRSEESRPDFRDIAASLGLGTDTMDQIARTTSTSLRNFLGVLATSPAYSPMSFDFCDYGIYPTETVAVSFLSPTEPVGTPTTTFTAAPRSHPLLS